MSDNRIISDAEYESLVGALTWLYDLNCYTQGAVLAAVHVLEAAGLQEHGSQYVAEDGQRRLIQMAGDVMRIWAEHWSTLPSVVEATSAPEALWVFVGKVSDAVNRMKVDIRRINGGPVSIEPGSG